MNEKRELGKVTAVHLGFEDHGIMSIALSLDFGGSVQGFGPIALSHFDRAKNRPVGTATGIDLVIVLLRLFKVDTLDAIKGRVVYALRSGGCFIDGLEIPEFDGGGVFSLPEWRRQWGIGEEVPRG